MTYRHSERRRSRESFTKVLARICTHLEADNALRIAWQSGFRAKSPQQSSVRVRSLWVAGSYARGAPHCGDLDLVADVVAEEGRVPGEPDIAHALSGGAKDISLYIGTPESNSSGITLPDARLVWSVTEYDWQKALAGIAVDPHATRFVRPTDVLPFRPVQLGVAELDDLERLVELHEQQIIDWDFIPIEAITVKESEWSADSLSFAKYLQQVRGKLTHEVMRYVIDYISRREPFLTWDIVFSRKSPFRYGGTVVLAGKPAVPMELLDELSCSELVVAPHLTRRGPNGLWMIRRGEQHPFERAFRGRAAFYLKAAGSPHITIEEAEPGNGVKARALKLFSSPEKAQAEVVRRKEDDTEYEVAMATGHDLLHLIACADVACVNGRRAVGITAQGRRFTGETKIASPRRLAAMLPPVTTAAG